MKITVALLQRLGACREGVEWFSKNYPDGVVPTRQMILDASRQHTVWLAQALCPDASVTLLKTYEDAEAPLWKTYRDAVAPLWKTYVDAKAPLLKTYEDAMAPLWKTYVDAKAPLWKTYKDAVIEALIAHLTKESSHAVTEDSSC